MMNVVMIFNIEIESRLIVNVFNVSLHLKPQAHLYIQIRGCQPI